MSDARTPQANIPDPDERPLLPEPPMQRVVLDRSSPSIRSIVRVVVVALVIVFIAGSVQNIITSITPLLFLIILSVFFAYLIDPLVRAIRMPFEDQRAAKWMPRWLAITIAYLFVFAILVGVISSIAPRVAEQAKEFNTSIPGFIQAIRTRTNDIDRRFDRLRVPDEVQAELNKKVTDLGSDITAWVGNFVLLSVTYLPWFFLVPILSFLFLKDANLFRLAVLRMFPAGPWRIRAESILQDVNTTLAAYTRAQLISCLIIAVICTIGFYFVGLKYALLLGIFAGIFEFVPLLGPLTIGIIVTLTAAGSEHPWNALYVAIFLIALRLVHDYVTYPRIVRGGIHLHPLAIILSVLAGEQVAGIPGVFISIPIVAVATVIYRHILEHQGRHSLVSGWIEGAEAPSEEAA
jgi:predicted PurR-regulated permease PerM